MLREITVPMTLAFLTVSVTFALLNPAPASAAPGGDAIVEETTHMWSTLWRNHTADIAICPSGRRAVSGGVVISHQGKSTIQLEVSAPVSEGALGQSLSDGDVARGWYAFVSADPLITPEQALSQTFSDHEFTHYRVVALCSATSDAVVATATFKVPAKSRAAGVAMCPEGMRAVGGGLRSLGEGSLALLLTNGPVDETGTFEFTETGDVARGWHVSVRTFWAEFDQFYKVFALCSRESDAIVEAIESPRGAVTCPSGRRVVGGGIGIASGDDSKAVIFFSGPQTDGAGGPTDGDVARRWAASTRSRGGIALPFKIFALCATNDP